MGKHKPLGMWGVDDTGKWSPPSREVAEAMDADNARLRELLAGLVECGPTTYNETSLWCFFCGKQDEFSHYDGCPWLLAKKWLEEHPSA